MVIVEYSNNKLKEIKETDYSGYLSKLIKTCDWLECCMSLLAVVKKIFGRMLG